MSTKLLPICFLVLMLTAVSVFAGIVHMKMPHETQKDSEKPNIIMRLRSRAPRMKDVTLPHGSLTKYFAVNVSFALLQPVNNLKCSIMIIMGISLMLHQ